MARTPRSSELPATRDAGPTELLEIETAEGLARAHVRRPGAPVGRLVLGHGAGGGVEAADLLAVRDALVAVGWAVALVEQPWRVAGRRVAVAPPRLDAAWRDVVRHLVSGSLDGGGPLVLGGRSAGARVACRTAAELSAAAVVCLAFPLHPPGRPERSRASELPDGLPTLVLQGRRDPFGGPAEVAAVAPAGVVVEAVDGDHGLARSAGDVGPAVARWLERLTRDPGMEPRPSGVEWPGGAGAAPAGAAGREDGLARDPGRGRRR